MANPTTNYGFVLPTSSDLVTDLPADFDVALQGVDTRLKALNPATTLGDLEYGSATANTNTRLGIGTTGQVLTVAGGVPSWATASSGSANVAGKNSCLNSNFSVWQRGTSIAQTSAALYTADRWQGYQGTATAITYSRQLTSDTTNLPFIQYCMRVQRNLSSSSTSQAQLAQSFETVNSIPYAGKSTTVSFYARKGANYSRTSDILTMGFTTGTGTDQNFYSGFTGASTAYTDFTLTSTWQRFTYTATVPTTATQLAVTFFFTPTGVALANDYYEVTGVQVEAASSASAYSPNAATFQGELAACQRYFYQFASGSTKAIGIGTYNTTSEAYTSVNFPVTMRTTPTLSATTGTAYYRFQRSGSSDDFNSLTMEAAHTNGTWLYNNTEMSGTAGVAGVMKTQDAASSLAFSAEL